MRSAMRTGLRVAGVGVGGVVVGLAAIGGYVYSILPKVDGELRPLQDELFRPPAAPLPMEGRYVFRTATELAALIRGGEVTSVDVTREFIAHIRNENHRLNAIVWLREAEALEDARRVDEAVQRGDVSQPLLGVPVTVKEQFWLKGYPVTLNTGLFSGFVAPEDGPLVTALREAGAVILGTTNVPMGLGDFQTVGEIYPVGNNPYDVTRTPGGSTGGGAAAVAAGFSAIELGADMGGSITVPAAFCGLYALKPTFGTLNVVEGNGPDLGVPFSRLALAVPGPLARSVEDVELAWIALLAARRDPRFQADVAWKEASARSLEQYRVAWSDDWPGEGGALTVGHDVERRLHELVATLEGHGVDVEKVIPDLYADSMRSYLVAYASMSGEGQPWLMRKLIALDMGKFDDGSVDLSPFYDELSRADDEGWAAWKRDNAALVAHWDTFFADHDFLVLPVTYGPAFRHSATGAPVEVDGSTVPYSRYLMPYSIAFSAPGNPVLSIPMGLDDAGLPIGLQIVGARNSEPELLKFGKLVAPLTPGFVRPPVP